MRKLDFNSKDELLKAIIYCLQEIEKEGIKINMENLAKKMGVTKRALILQCKKYDLEVNMQKFTSLAGVKYSFVKVAKNYESKEELVEDIILTLRSMKADGKKICIVNLYNELGFSKSTFINRCVSWGVENNFDKFCKMAGINDYYNDKKAHYSNEDEFFLDLKRSCQILIENDQEINGENIIKNMHIRGLATLYRNLAKFAPGRTLEDVLVNELNIPYQNTKKNKYTDEELFKRDVTDAYYELKNSDTEVTKAKICEKLGISEATLLHICSRFYYEETTFEYLLCNVLNLDYINPKKRHFETEKEFLSAVRDGYYHLGDSFDIFRLCDYLGIENCIFYACCKRFEIDDALRGVLKKCGIEYVPATKEKDESYILDCIRRVYQIYGVVKQEYFDSAKAGVCYSAIVKKFKNLKNACDKAGVPYDTEKSKHQITVKKLAEEIIGHHCTGEEVTFEWLVNDDIKPRHLYCDIYFESEKIVIEADGKQHYEYPNIFHKNYGDYELQLKRDGLKDKKCKEHGIHVIRITEKEIFGLHKDVNVLNNIKSKIQNAIDNPYYGEPGEAMIMYPVKESENAA